MPETAVPAHDMSTNPHIAFSGPMADSLIANRSAHLPDELITVIAPSAGWQLINLRELWKYHELLYFLIWRDVKVRYKQTVLGAAWAILQPLFGMVVFTGIFGRLAGIKSDGVSYAAFVFAGLVPWTFFANGVTAAGQSLISQQQLLTKVYFPRLLVPASAFGAPLLDMLISFVVLAVVMAFTRVAPTRAAFYLPLLILLTTLAGIGVGLILAAMTVSYRDFKFVIPFMIQAWMYVSPVVYPVSLFPARYRLLLAINPMAGLIDAYRACLLGTPLHPSLVGLSALSSIILFVFGLFYFRKVERRFADVI
jgi:lipopolysaccharide transport system permease protein